MANVRLVQHDRSGGQSAAVHSGVRAANGAIIATLDGDGQNPPAELPKLYAPLIDPAAPADLGLVAGQRVKRQDTWSKRYASKFANALRGWALNDGTRDTGCGLKAFRREALSGAAVLQPHAPLPARAVQARRLAAGAGRCQPPAAHRRAARTIPTGSAGLVGAVDLIGVMWLLRRRKTATATEAAPKAGPNQ